jgi:hypothetical protein
MNSIDELRQLAASMRHSAGTYMVPGYDGNKVANLIESALAYSAPKWQDIATAPKDVAVLVYVSLLDETVRAHKDEDGAWHGYAGEKWIGEYATHWQPLPPPPLSAAPEAK